MPGHHFVSYSTNDAQPFAAGPCDALEAEGLPTWLDGRRLEPGRDWDEQIAEAIRSCDSLLFVMTRDSVEAQSVCKQEWALAMKYKKPVIPLLLHGDADVPFRLSARQHVDFTGLFEPALHRLRDHLRWLASPAGRLQELKDRLADARRDLRRANGNDQARIQDDIAVLEGQVAQQQGIVDDPDAADRRVRESIAKGLEQERNPARPVAGGVARGRFINPPPGVAPGYFQDRVVETRLVGEMIRDEAYRLVWLVGRGGIGKTALVCRLLKALEGGQLPDGGGHLPVRGIVYLSAVGSRRVTAANLYCDLCKLLTRDAAERLDEVCRDAKTTTRVKILALLGEFPAADEGPAVVLLDNFEDVIDPATLAIQDAELDEGLRALLDATHHGITVVVTTRVAPRNLLLVQPARQKRLDLDEGLPAPYAQNILREMDADGKVGLRDAPDALLDEARQRTRGYPRALEALFGILSADRDAGIREVLDAAADALPENVVEVLVGEAFSRLDAAAQQVMQALAVYGRPVLATAVDYLLQLHVPGIDSARVLSRLTHMHFARKEAGRYYLHPVDRVYALSRVPRGDRVDGSGGGSSPPFTQIALGRRAAGYFCQARLPREKWKTIEDLSPQLAEFELRYACGDYNDAADVLAEIDADYLLTWGFSRLVAEMHERLQGKLETPRRQAASAGSLAAAYRRLGEISKAIACYERSLELSRGIADRRAMAICFSGLGDCYLSLGNAAETIAHYDQALRLAREVGDRRTEGNLLGGLGECHSSVGEISRGSEFLERALAIAREIGDRRGEGDRLGGLGTCFLRLGKIAEGIEHTEQALLIAREVGDRRGECRRLGNLAIGYGCLGQITRAIEYNELGLSVARQSGDRAGEAVCTNSLGHCWSKLGQTAKAIDWYLQALAINRKIGNRLNEGMDLANLGIHYADLALSALAVQNLEQAIAICQETGHRSSSVWCRANLAAVLTDLGRHGEAVERAKEALEVARDIPELWIEHHSLIWFIHHALAVAHFYAGDAVAARASAETALRSHFTEYKGDTAALLGVIALRQDDATAAREAFRIGASHAESTLVITPQQHFSAADARGLALCGLALCGEADQIPSALVAFRTARAITRAAGIVARVLRLLDALAVCDTAGVLAGVRPAAAGHE